MGKKKDMYINYDRTNKRRGRKGRNRYYITMAIFLLICLSLSVYFIVLAKETAQHNKDKSAKNPTAAAVLTNKPTTLPVITENPAELPSVTVPPTQAPTPTVQPTVKPVVNDNVIMGGAKSTKAIKGIYVPANAAASDKINKLINIADKTEINAMVIDVKDDHGKISYAMDCKMAKKIGAVTNTIPDMRALVKQLKARNIYLIARVVAFKDPYLASKRKALAIKNQDGTLYKDNNGENWVNPYNKKVWSYLIDVASQAAATGFDEIQFDYIRFSTSKGITEANLGQAAKSKSKESIITEFTKYACEKLKPLGVAVSADVYGTIIASSVDAKVVGQNFVEMSKYLDYICPMIYPSHFGEGNFGIQYPDMEPYHIISKVLAISADKLKAIPEGEHCAVVRPWLQDFTATWIKHHQSYSGKEVREEIEGVYSVGYNEWLLWNAASNYSKDGLLAD